MTMKVLGIETSCDETACAVIENGRRVISNVVFSQAKEHTKYGGIVPELASRRQIEEIVAVYEKALFEAKIDIKKIDLIAVTAKPGLIGSLLVGVNFAKAVSLGVGVPLVEVDHILGHVASNYISNLKLEPPFICLVASGGHTQIMMVNSYTDFEIIGQTRDDAAGEAFDKVGRILGLGYPAGAQIDHLAAKGDSRRYKLPRPKVEGGEFDFSFSGLKTAAINTVHSLKQRGENIDISDMAACFQTAVVEVLVDKFIKAALLLGATKLCLAGGVSANMQLRRALQEECKHHKFELFMPELCFCGDNAAMIASEGYYDVVGH